MSWLAKRLPHRVRVEVETNIKGPLTDGRMGWLLMPEVVAGMESVPCLVTLDKGRSILNSDREGAINFYSVLFAQTLTLPMQYQLVWVDPADGRTHYLRADGVMGADTATSNRCIPALSGGSFIDYAE